jgi:Ala-tRNA(Pro) deacylase
MSDSTQDQVAAGIEARGLRAVTEYLEGAGVSFEVIEHPRTETAAAEAREAHVPGDRMAKTVVVHDGGAPILAVIPADHRLDLDKLRAALGATGPLRLATEYEIAQHFPELEPGAIPPVGPTLVGATVVDARLLEHHDVVCAGGDHHHAIRLSGRDLIRLADARIADISHDWASGEPRVHF